MRKETKKVHMAMKKVEVVATLGAGMKITSRVRDHLVISDQPKAGGGTDAGPTPLEHLLCALAGCIASIARIAATQKKIGLRSIEVSVSGELDADALLGRPTRVRAGFGEILVRAKMDADLTDEQKRQFLKEVDERCPVSDNLRQLTQVTTELIP